MKNLLITALLAVSMLAYAEEEKKKPVITTPKGWSTSLAQVQAAAKKKPDTVVAVLFAGADQIKLQQDVLTNPFFMRYAAQKLVLAYVPLPKAQAKKQESGEGETAAPAKPDPSMLIRAKYKITGANCTLLLTDTAGKELGRITRILPAKDYTTQIKKILAPVPEIIVIARSNNLKKMTQYLEEHPEEVNTSDAFGTTAVAEATRRNNLKMLELLFSKKADPNRKGNGGMSPFMLWSQRNQKATAVGDLLLKNGAAINARDAMGRTPLMIAIQANSQNTVTYLLEKGARIDATNPKGETPLIYAIRRKNPAMLKLLIEKGAKVRRQDNAGNTPLHIAATIPGIPPEIIQILLQNGASKNSKNFKRQTPFMVARDANIKKLLK